MVHKKISLLHFLKTHVTDALNSEKYCRSEKTKTIKKLNKKTKELEKLLQKVSNDKEQVELRLEESKAKA